MRTGNTSFRDFRAVPGVDDYSLSLWLGNGFFAPFHEIPRVGSLLHTSAAFADLEDALDLGGA